METNKQKKKIFFLIPAFRGGGAERVISNIANNLDRKKFEVGIITISEGGHKYLLSEDVKHFNLGKKKAREAIFSLIRLLRKEKPDVVVATVIQSIIILYLTSFFIKKETTIVSRLANHYSKTMESQKSVQRTLFKKALLASDHIITISHEMEQDLLDNIKIEPQKIQMIYNPIDIKSIQEKAQEEAPAELFNKRPVLTACGRLAEQKGFSYLIKAFGEIKKEFSNAQLLIIGEGELKEELQNLAASVGVEEDTHFLGFQNNPFKYTSRSDIFVLSSLYEGLPSALLEAMACGVPIVSTDCPSGPKEILENGKNGQLVKWGNINELVSGIRNLLNNKELQENYRQRGKNKVMEFSIKEIIKDYNNFIEKI
jgi:glycosyltransferase involved in cell wall biosynthesis